MRDRQSGAVQLGFAIPGVSLKPGMMMELDTDVRDDDGQGRKSLQLWMGTRIEFWLSLWNSAVGLTRSWHRFDSFVEIRMMDLFGERQRDRVRILGWVVLCCGVYCWLTAAPGAAADWPSFRGPHSNGVSDERDWVTEWPPAGPKIAWRRGVGIGASSFAVVGDRVVTMGSRKATNEDTVWCLDANDGRVVWQYTYPCKFDARQFEGGTASTPTINDGLVHTLGYLGQLHCLALEDGHVMWQKNLVDDFDGRYSSWKYAGSPLVIGDRLFIDTGAVGNSTVCLDKRTGRKIWGSGDDLAGYSTPVPFRFGGQDGVLVFKARALVALGRDTGREMWRVDWRTNYDVNASVPTVVGDRLFISTGYGGHRARGALFQLGPNPPTQIWLNQDIETKMNSAVLYEGYIYCISEKSGGQLMCVDLRDGRTVWTERRFAPYGTLMIAAGKLVILDEKGAIVIARADPKGYRELARAQVLEGRCWAMPVLANGRIYARSNMGKMVCIDVCGV